MHSKRWSPKHVFVRLRSSGDSPAMWKATLHAHMQALYGSVHGALACDILAFDVSPNAALVTLRVLDTDAHFFMRSFPTMSPPTHVLSASTTLLGLACA